MIISDYLLDMEEHHCVILSNIFFLNIYTTITPRSGKEPALKKLKIS